MTASTFTEQDTQTFATKLAAFSQTLTPGEQAILTLIEQRLGADLTTDTTDTSDEDDVHGYMIDLDTVAMVRQREMLHEADRIRAGLQAHAESTAPDEVRIGLWQRIARSLGHQATAMSPRPST